MKRRAFLRSIIAAVALAPVLANARRPINAFPGYWIKQRINRKRFGIEAVTDTFVRSPKQNTTWTVKAGEMLTFISEDLYIYGGSHYFITPSELKRREEGEYNAWMKDWMESSQRTTPAAT